MTSYRYLGSGTTDSNGVAHLTEDASGETVTGYVGQGVGEMEIFATLDNPVTQSSIQSEPYTVIDGLIFHDGTSNKNVFASTITLSRSVTSDGTVLSYSGSGTGYAYLDYGNTEASLDFDAPYCLEFILVSYTGGASVYCGTNTFADVVEKTFTELNCTGNNRVKLTYDGSYVDIFVDNDRKVHLARNYDTNQRLGFRINGTGNLTYKDLVVYRI